MSKRFVRPTIAITGSSGKTTTRELIASILETKWRIIKTKGNFNLPLHTKETAAQFNDTHRAMLLELGMGKQGAGRRHCRYIKPQISVITNVGTAHIGNLGNSIKSTAHFKSSLIHHMDPQGVLIINRDDRHSRLLETRAFKGRIVTIGIKHQADYRAQHVKYVDGGMSFQVELNDALESFMIPTYGIHNVYNALFAIAVSHLNRFSPRKIRAGLAKYVVPAHRLNVQRFKGKGFLIDDTINANPHAMKAAIRVLLNIREKDEAKVAVLGSMLELGEYSEKGHREVGHYLAQKKFDAIYCYGAEAKWIVAGAIDAGIHTQAVHHFKNRTHLHQQLKRDLTGRYAILVKGSRLMEMDLTAQYLQEMLRS